MSFRDPYRSRVLCTACHDQASRGNFPSHYADYFPLSIGVSTQYRRKPSHSQQTTFEANPMHKLYCCVVRFARDTETQNTTDFVVAKTFRLHFPPAGTATILSVSSKKSFVRKECNRHIALRGAFRLQSKERGSRQNRRGRRHRSICTTACWRHPGL